MKSSRTKKKIGLLHQNILTVLGTGLIPFAPGTWGTVAALPLIYFLYPRTTMPTLLLVNAISVVLSAIYLQIIAKKYSLKDPGWVVLDEFVAILFAASLSPRYDLLGVGALFILFRFFDIVKIWPCGLVDSKIKNGLGILLDDLLAAIQSLALLYLFHYFFNFYA